MQVAAMDGSTQGQNALAILHIRGGAVCMFLLCCILQLCILCFCLAKLIDSRVVFLFRLFLSSALQALDGRLVVSDWIRGGRK